MIEQTKNKQAENKSALQEITQLVEGTGAKVDKTIPAIEVKNYTKKFKRFVSTDNVSFTVNHGVIHGLIGPNGSGKTTTIKALIGAYKPTSGELLINGHKAGTKKSNKLIGYIPERASFPRHLNSIQYLQAMGEFSGIKPKIAKERSKQILSLLGLEAQARRKPITFSSGMQKKILLAQSILINPSILILDEPAANLDPSARKELFDQLITLRNQGKTILISSHILAELERIVDEITFVYYGEILFSGDVRDFNNTEPRIYLKTDNNAKVVKYLESKKISFSGDIKTEIEIKNLSKLKTQNLIQEIIKLKVNIETFRNNDLQSAYEALAHNANKERKGKQVVKESAFYSWKLKQQKKREGKK